VQVSAAATRKLLDEPFKKIKVVEPIAFRDLSWPNKGSDTRPPPAEGLEQKTGVTRPRA
jgi:hypothetical protein